MVFSSYLFIFLFLPITLTGYYSLSKMNNKRYQQLFLVIASLFFYGYFNIIYLIIIVSSIFVNFALAKVMTNCINTLESDNRRSSVFLHYMLIVGLIFNLGLLGYFKYYDFFVQNVNTLFGTSFLLKHILLPLGISFFTFQQIAFLISIYRREEKLEHFIDYCLFVLFFPQLVAGPIVLYKEMMPQFTEDSRRFVNYDNIAKGIYIFTIGLFKKAVIADTVALFANNGFGSSELGFAAAWVTSLSYTLQIYFDFSGYSDMAIGLGKMFNIDIPINFNSPYKSESITAFWRRWHITLGRFLTAYVYIPLGGNRRGITRTCINLLLTFLVSGLWHGAAWTFVLWGALHGMAIAVERVFKGVLNKIPKALRICGTFFIVNILWVLFRAESIDKALNVYKGMVNIWDVDINAMADIAFDGLINFPTSIDLIYVFAIISILTVIVFCSKNTLEKAKVFSPTPYRILFTVVLFCVSVIHFSRESIFIYFNF